MTTVESISQTATDQATVLKNLAMGRSSASQSGVEPVSGLQGKGTATEPYDQGNADDTAVAGVGNSSIAAPQSGVEPVSGLQGKGTVTEPYDQGNADDPVLSGEEPPSGVQGRGTITEPYDGGNAPENPKDPSSKNTSSAATSTTLTSGKSAVDERGRNGLTAPAKNKVEERELSPGCLDDGTHVQTSGDRGETYEPSKMSKLKGKLTHFGKH
ncbi:hypothetical protein LTR99_004701 [Exophiala xenobiotica]|uniref:Uncharacterized protein n=1 Tax=Vermiconidia calcicola TaxID=1690605 RepID=A0AAV9QEJ7_9PEZI|nr:hypothetical protein LTR47_001792 [Exophiala xenobiotica]KAK5531688.1 hypothetical protein LTR23_009804 [Chaetothyriales sp. CCFEE 6169]KAK5539982.1 hypothetical protein LTR25_003687 [Vermiconidia calcicola]KAK5304245.1 hypothetical protein LTR99_004701 [Exophiala xenobiotica]KAK5338854.1 hypothetical protein LTR98_005254 [Exophiala xenobiotica]